MQQNDFTFISIGKAGNLMNEKFRNTSEDTPVEHVISLEEEEKMLTRKSCNITKDTLSTLNFSVVSIDKGSQAIVQLFEDYK